MKFRQSIILFLACFISFSVYAGGNELATQDCFTGKSLCMAVVDAGSSGSRLHIYRYELNDRNMPDQVKEVWVQMHFPGLSTVADNPKALEMYLSDLFKKIPVSDKDDIRPLSKLAAEREVRGDTERRTGVYTPVHEDSSTVSTKQFSSAVEFGKRSQKVPLYFYGTAGMRLLPEKVQDSTYQKVKTFVQEDIHLWNLKDIRTITGQEEGVFGWLAMNHHLGLLDTSKTAVSYMDMGGASVQVVTPVHKRHFKRDDNDYVSFNYHGQKISLFSKSFLGLGQTQVLNQFLEKGKCYANGFKMVNQKFAAGNAQYCEENVERLVNQVHDVHNIVQPVLQNNPSKQWYVTGGVVYMAKDTILDLPQDGFTNNSLLSAVESKVCTAQWPDLKASYPNHTRLQNYCLIGAYYHALMVKGYGIDSGENIHILTNNDFDWSLGVLLKVLAS